MVFTPVLETTASIIITYFVKHLLYAH